MQTCPEFLLKSLLESPGYLLEICSVKFVDTLLNIDCLIAAVCSFIADKLTRCMFACMMRQIREDKSGPKYTMSRRVRHVLRDNSAVVRARRCFAVQFPNRSEHSDHVFGPVRLMV